MLLPVPPATSLTPVFSLFGGALIGLGAATLWVGNGRVAGVSGVLGGLIDPKERDWKFAFVAGMLLTGLIARVLGIDPSFELSGPRLLLVPAGLLVGLGAALAGGCGSGHGICGLSRLSPRSIAATATFMGVAFLAVFLTRVIGGMF